VADTSGVRDGRGLFEPRFVASVLEVVVNEGDQDRQRATLWCCWESMKMEIPVCLAEIGRHREQGERIRGGRHPGRRPHRGDQLATRNPSNSCPLSVICWPEHTMPGPGNAVDHPARRWVGEWQLLGRPCRSPDYLMWVSPRTTGRAGGVWRNAGRTPAPTVLQDRRGG